MPALPPLDPDVAAVLAQLRRADCAPADPLVTPLAQARAQFGRQLAFFSERSPRMARTETLYATHGGRTVRVRIHFPHDTLPAPLIVYLHGGGWVFGTLDTHDRIMREIATASGIAVAGIEYTLAPEAKYPDQLGEIGRAVTVLIENSRALGIDPRRLILFGDSAGGNLALATALHGLDGDARAGLTGLILFYGVYAPGCEAASWRDRGDGSYGLAERTMRWYWSQYLPDPDAMREAPAAPLNGRLNGLPPTWLAVGDLDPLHDDTLLLAERLRKQGTPHRLTIYQGYPHGFLRMMEQVPGVQHAFAQAGQAARDMLAGTLT